MKPAHRHKSAWASLFGVTLVPGSGVPRLPVKEEMVDPDLQSLSTQLAQLVIRNTAGAIHDKITAIKAKRQADETIGELEQIVNDLIADKAEMERIARAYEEELVAQRISDDDVAYITTSIVPVLKQLANVSDDGEAAKAMKALEPILSAETVTILQLLGFNFRRAVGEPLTDLVRRAILAKAAPTGDAAVDLSTLQLRREVAYVELAQDPEAYARLQALFGRS